MNGRRILVLTASLALAIAAGACGNKNVEESNKAGEEKRRAYATEEADNILSVDAFGLTVKKPDGWHAASFEELNGITNTATHIITADRPELKSTIKSADKNLYNLFSISQFGPEKTSTDNHNIGAVAERVSHVPGIKTGKDYWEEAKKLFAQANAEYNIEDEYTTRVIGGVVFDQINLTLDMAGSGPINQSYYAAPKGEFMVLIFQTWKSEEGEQATSDIIDTIKLDW